MNCPRIIDNLHSISCRGLANKPGAGLKGFGEHVCAASIRPIVLSAGQRKPALDLQKDCFVIPAITYN